MTTLLKRYRRFPFSARKAFALPGMDTVIEVASDAAQVSAGVSVFLPGFCGRDHLPEPADKMSGAVERIGPQFAKAPVLCPSLPVCTGADESRATARLAADMR
jgi:hypothetical protein